MKLRLSVFARAGNPKDLFVCEHSDTDDISYGEGKVWADNHDDYIRLATPSICDFLDLDNEEIIQQHVTSIDEKITDVRAKANAVIEELTQRKRDLLQITFVSAGEE